MYLLDTNVVSELRKVPSGRANSGVVAWAQANSAQLLFISAITLMELKKGVLLKARNDPKAGEILGNWLEQRVSLAFQGRVLPVDERVALVNASFHVPVPRPLADSLIAATAKVHGLSLVTRNVKDFAEFQQTHGLHIVDPWS